MVLSHENPNQNFVQGQIFNQKKVATVWDNLSNPINGLLPLFLFREENTEKNIYRKFDLTRKRT